VIETVVVEAVLVEEVLTVALVVVLVVVVLAVEVLDGNVDVPVLEDVVVEVVAAVEAAPCKA